MRKAVIIMFSILILSSGFQAVSAEIFFPSTNVRLDGPGTYCIDAPSDELVQDKSKEWVQIVENAVLEWEKNLKEAEFENESFWELDVKEISGQDDDCDVKIEFKNKPNLSDTVAGYFSFPPGNIVIYYLQPKICTGLVPCYDNKTLKSDEMIFAIAIHEIGHSLGLDHYVSDDNDVNKKWQSGSSTPPSVMIPTIPRTPSLLKITDIDVQKVREIYGLEGFNAFSDAVIPTPKPGPAPGPFPEPIIPLSPFVSIGISDKVIEADRYDRKIVTVSGRISEDEYHRGLPVVLTIHKPDDSVEVLKVNPASSGYFESLLIFDGESVKGIYRISASYVEQVDKNMDITFEVVDKKIKPATQGEPSILEQSQSQKNSGSNNQKIPNWIKNNAKWWSNEQIGDQSFVSGIQYLIEKNILQIPNLPEINTKNTDKMPVWIKNIAGYWSDDIISDEEFIKSIQYLVENGIVVIP